MNQFIHYFALLFIIFICAEIRNVLINETPYDSEPISIWSESVNTNPLAQVPTVKLL